MEQDAKKLAEALERAKQFASSKEGRELAAAFGQGGGERAARAAECLKTGDPGAMKAFLESLSETEEGKTLIRLLSGGAKQ